MNGEKEYDTEYRVIWPDGSVHWIKGLGQVIRDADGHPVRMIGINYDITEIKKSQEQMEEINHLLERRVEKRTADLTMANAELLRANRAKDEFFSTMSHELRTPLNGILGLSESLQEGTYGPLVDQQKAALHIVQESGEHLLQLINDILDISKAEAGQMELHVEKVILKDLIDASLRLINPQAMKKHLKLATSYDVNLGTLAGDERRLKQMLVNLLSNAVKFTPEGGRIGLEIDRENEGEAIRFTVLDTGIGIPQDRISQLFQPFVQVDSSLTRQCTGTGPGLAFVSRLARLHGGSVGVESVEGEGSRFWFTIPVSQILKSDEELDPELNRTKLSIKAPQRVLLIEDSLLAADHLANFLRELNTEVIIHPFGQNSVSAAIEVNPDVILLDILLPDTSGWQVLSQLKTNPHTMDIPVVFVAVVDERKRGISAGANHSKCPDWTVLKSFEDFAPNRNMRNSPSSH